MKAKILVVVANVLIWIGMKIDLVGYYIAHLGIMLDNYVLRNSKPSK